MGTCTCLGSQSQALHSLAPPASSTGQAGVSEGKRGVFSGLGQSAAVPATTTATGSGSEAADQQDQLLTQPGSQAPGDLPDQSASA